MGILKNIFFFLLFSAKALAAPSYTTTCSIEGSTAKGGVNNHGDSFEIDGNVLFYFYDASGRFIDSEDEYEYEYVSSRSWEEIETTSAPSNAASCNFDVSGAIAGQTPIPVSYTTTCDLRNGNAYGGVNNHSDAFEIDGNVFFYFYDSRGRLVDTEDEYEYEYISSRSWEEVEYTSAASGAVSCNFDISEAIKN
jgi:hypothetical protein